jgi:hypothetical protein
MAEGLKAATGGWGVGDAGHTYLQGERSGTLSNLGIKDVNGAWTPGLRYRVTGNIGTGKVAFNAEKTLFTLEGTSGTGPVTVNWWATQTGPVQVRLEWLDRPSPAVLIDPSEGQDVIRPPGSPNNDPLPSAVTAGYITFDAVADFQPAITSTITSPALTGVGGSLTDVAHVGVAAGEAWPDDVPVTFTANLYGPITGQPNPVTGGTGDAHEAPERRASQSMEVDPERAQNPDSSARRAWDHQARSDSWR